MEYYSATKRNISVCNNMDKSHIHYARGNNLGLKRYLMFDSIYYDYSGKDKMADRNQICGCQGLAVRKRDRQMGRRELFEVMKIFSILSVMVTWLYTFVKIHRNVHIQRVSSAICILYLNKHLSIWTNYIFKANKIQWYKATIIVTQWQSKNIWGE